MHHCPISEVILVNRGWVPEERMPPSRRADGRVAGKQRIEGIVRLGESVWQCVCLCVCLCVRVCM